ncbi:malate synthase [Kordiimonas sediminis]|uniref:Malate synthase n=1 Tax=Kordiimonas sediminis TaxID=1735581 RepID=A0A919AK94_9PROT|nr:malate synthase A [Kordiimonas sediminis]GHF12707.1 malate synthase [Kordiimonas sediminis]
MSTSAQQKEAPFPLEIIAPMEELYSRVLTGDALAFVAELEAEFGTRREQLLEDRASKQEEYDAGSLPDFDPETRDIRDGDWQIAGTPDDLQDRRVEITGPVDRKMMINAFNSGANVFMADFEDASSPTWDNMVSGQINMYDYARGQLAYTDPKSGKNYEMAKKTAVLKVRPRGWHMTEAHACLNGKPISAGLFDFGLFMYHNAKALLDAGKAPYFYLPKMENHKEAKLWDDAISFAENALGIPHGTVKVTVLIETLPAAFQMDEILHALKDHIVGLNCGRWDYIFSYIKRIGKNAAYLLPDRGKIVMGEAFLKAYSLLLIQTCHKRGAHAMGGMAAQIPVKGDDAANEIAYGKVRADKEREANNGHDGTWVAHPGMVALAKEAFDKIMPGKNQIDNLRTDITITQEDLLRPHEGDATTDGLKENIRIGVQYLEAWISGRGAVPLYNLMEDAATAEIGRTQIWQQLYHKTKLADGQTVTQALVKDLYEEEMAAIKAEVGADRYDSGRYDEAGALFLELSFADSLAEFLTTPAYELIK